MVREGMRIAQVENARARLISTHARRLTSRADRTAHSKRHGIEHAIQPGACTRLKPASGFEWP
jgi:hypothetical protein